MAKASGSTKAATLFAAAMAFGVFAPGAAEAASRFCRQLEARLEEPSGSAQFRRFERAAEEQLRDLIEVEGQARSRGCLDGGGDALCRGLLGTLDRMDRNLAALERRLDLLAQRNDGGRERARIMAALDANRCGEDEEEVRILPPDPGQIRILPPPIEPEGQESRNVITGPFNAGGTFRTLCVRTCDGYYFPISFSVTPDLFDRDQRKCEAMCPGTEVQLYSHRVPGEESEDMVTGAGTPYSSLPTAFKYREAGYVRPQGCGCSPAKNFSVVAGEPPDQSRPADRVTQPPVQANPAAETTAPGAAGDEAKVRVVGPAFLPDPEGAIDLRAPGRSEVR